MYSLIKLLFFGQARLKIFAVSRLGDNDISEKVFIHSGKGTADISQNHGMVCLDPFCIAVWLLKDSAASFVNEDCEIRIHRGLKVVAALSVSFMEQALDGDCVLLLYKLGRVRNFQQTPLHRVVLFAYLLRNKTSTYHYRRTISALYSYPRQIIIVSFKGEGYCNIFPMDIQGYVIEGGMYVLGLRTTNVTLGKIIEAGKVVVCDTDSASVDTVYTLGKHPSASPPDIGSHPFATYDSEMFGFPVPDFSGSYKEIEIIMHKKLGYHMLLVGRIVNHKIIRQDRAPLHHISFLEYLKSGYPAIDGQY